MTRLDAARLAHAGDGPGGRAGRVGRAPRRAAAAAGGAARRRSRSGCAACPGGRGSCSSSRAFSLLPVVESSGYVRRVGFDTVLYMLLALGLNVVVGWGGLLDLGYVAFYGIGAYAYAILDSDKFGIHLPTLVAVPVVVVIGAIVGLLVGLPSRRLTGDYLAIVTLFFLQLFQTLTTNGDSAFGHNLTGGPNGILQGRPVPSLRPRPGGPARGRLRRLVLLRRARRSSPSSSSRSRFVNHSRTGRAWRSLREDPLAAEAMGMPVNWLKLMSFSFGAAVAALTGTLFAALNASVFPLTLLLRAADHRLHDGDPRRLGQPAGRRARARSSSARCSSCCATRASRASSSSLALVGGLVLAFRRSRTLARRRCGDARRSASRCTSSRARSTRRGWRARRPAASPASSTTGSSHPPHLARWVAPVSYIGLIVAALARDAAARPRCASSLLVPTLYLAAFVWENVMLAKPEPARYIVLGADPDRADDPAAERPARRAPRGDRLMPLLELQRRLARVRRAHGRRRARPARRRGRDRQRDRPERRRQDDALQPDHRASTGRTAGDILLDGRSIVGLAAASDQPVAASRARSRRCASS